MMGALDDSTDQGQCDCIVRNEYSFHPTSPRYCINISKILHIYCPEAIHQTLDEAKSINI
jgi:hypothetical protein